MLILRETFVRGRVKLRSCLFIHKCNSDSKFWQILFKLLVDDHLRVLTILFCRMRILAVSHLGRPKLDK